MKKLFLFEFATCGEEIDDSIAVEGLAMFKAALNGFGKFYEINSFVRRPYTSQFGLPEGSLKNLEGYLEKSDAFLIVAPEDEGLLLELTKIGERYAENLGSSSKAISITSDKWVLYKKLKMKVNLPKTSKRPLDGTFVIKPRTSCAGEGIRFSEAVPQGYIAQEYIEGKNLSVSVIAGEDIRAASVNEQILDGFKYIGSVVPARLDDKTRKEVINEALKAVECIRGLNGYVGVDVVYSDMPYIIEINARLTTPVAAFERAYGITVADYLYGARPKFKKRQIIRKGVNLNGFFVRSGNYCLQISDF
ncbi:ATP-grasp domain-containing protein [Archaeoglobus neptunius]|uniref:ATP-grasp domain-containing protein n=1 Tax=Archaeoglobus neptunius TaxID=2798580 RepID=UPI0019264AFF|nr:ATP-grasp domain-containing protein [Archaeoglobus neptunius]